MEARKAQHTWQIVRHWLHDLAEELADAMQEKMPLCLDIHRVWISEDGRVKLLDFDPPGTESGCANASVTPDNPPVANIRNEDAQLFLKQAASIALTGKEVSAEEVRNTAIGAAVPPHAKSFLDALPASSDFSSVVTNLGALLGEVPAVSSSRRFLLLLGCSIPAILALLAVPVCLLLFKNIWPLIPTMTRIEALEKEKTEASQRERHDFEVYVANRFRDSLATKWILKIEGDGVGSIRQRLMRILKDHPDPTEDEIAKAELRVSAFLKKNESAVEIARQGSRFLTNVLPIAAYSMGIFTVVPGLLTALIFRGGLLMHGLGLAVVLRDGRPASRPRLFIRSIVGWSPLMAYMILPAPYHWVAFGVLVSCSIHTVLHPQRGLHDVITGTALVPQ